jgi:rubredoxin
MTDRPCPLISRRVALMLGPALAAAGAADAAGRRWACGRDQCPGYVHDPARGEPSKGVAPGADWAGAPNAFRRPRCGAGKDEVAPAP